MKRKWAQETSMASATSANLSSLQQKGQVSFSLSKCSACHSLSHLITIYSYLKLRSLYPISILFQLRCSSPQYLERSPSVPSPFSWPSQPVSSSYAKAKVQCFFSSFKILAKKWWTLTFRDICSLNTKDKMVYLVLWMVEERRFIQKPSWYVET